MYIQKHKYDMKVEQWIYGERDLKVWGRGNIISHLQEEHTYEHTHTLHERIKDTIWREEEEEQEEMGS